MEEKVFRDQISSYIEGELNDIEYINFSNFMNNNPSFSNEVDKIRNLMLQLNSLDSTETKNDFMANLNQRIDMIESSYFDRILKFNPYNSKLFQKLSLVAAILVVVSSSYILLNQDINMNVNGITEQQDNFIDDYDVAQQESISDSDTTDINDSRIRLVGGND